MSRGGGRSLPSQPVRGSEYELRLRVTCFRMVESQPGALSPRAKGEPPAEVACHLPGEASAGSARSGPLAAECGGSHRMGTPYAAWGGAGQRARTEVRGMRMVFRGRTGARRTLTSACEAGGGGIEHRCEKENERRVLPARRLCWCE